MVLSRNDPEISTKSPDRVYLGSLTFDRATRELRDAAGDPISLRRQSGEVLAELAERAGEAVSKEHLIGAIWGGVAVTDDSLVQCIADIRRVLGPEARACLRTVPRRGYRLVPSTNARPAQAQRWMPRRWYFVPSIMAALAILLWFAMPEVLGKRPPVAIDSDPRPTLAVLPFANFNDNPDQLYFSDGLTEDLSTDLSRVAGLRVISSASSFRYRDTQLSPEEVALALGASHLVTGTVRRDGRRIRINATLTEVSTGASVWANRYDRDIGRILDMQNDVAKAIAFALAVELTDSEEERFQRQQRIDPDAYDHLLRGLAPLRRFTYEGILEAREYFRRAIAIDPDYARAHANLALTYATAIVFRLGDYREANEDVLREVLLAVELDPTLPQAQFALAVVHLSNRNHDAAIAAAQEAVRLDPSYADGFAVLAQTLGYAGDLEEALAAIRTAKSLSPLHTFAYLWVEAHVLFQLRRYEEARAILEQVVERNPVFLLGLTLLAATYGSLEMEADAEWLALEIQTISPQFSSSHEALSAPYKSKTDRNHYREALLRAGLPE